MYAGAAFHCADDAFDMFCVPEFREDFYDTILGAVLSWRSR